MSSGSGACGARVRSVRSKTGRIIMYRVGSQGRLNSNVKFRLRNKTSRNKSYGRCYEKGEIRKPKQQCLGGKIIQGKGGKGREIKDSGCLYK